VRALSRFLPDLEGSPSILRAAWDRLAKLPGGTWAFDKLVGNMAPYTGTMGAHVVELSVGHARVELRDRRAVRNHLRSIHAIALANLAELTGNGALAYSMPDDARFIVTAIRIEYLKKARGTITATCSCPVPKTSHRAEYEVPVRMHDPSGNEVARATLTTLIGPRRDTHRR
jgi:uncharacterized protein (TIGR00369 family)